MVDDVQSAWKVSTRRACAVIRMETSTYHYRGKRRSRAALIGRIKEIAATRVRYGYRRFDDLVRRVKAKPRDDRRPPERANETWTTILGRQSWDDNLGVMDFVHAQLATGRKICVLTIMDIENLNGKFRAECLNAHCFMSLDDAAAKCGAWRRDHNELARTAGSATDRRRAG
jgi:putative transposase